MENTIDPFVRDLRMTQDHVSTTHSKESYPDTDKEDEYYSKYHQPTTELMPMQRRF